MFAALVGSLGILVGVVLGGVVQLRGDRRVRRVEAIATIRLMWLELWAAYTKLTKAADQSRLWHGDISTSMWDEHSVSMSFDLDESVLQEVSESVAVIKSWNATAHSVRDGSGAKLPEKNSEGEDIESSLRKIERAINDLKKNKESLVIARRNERGIKRLGVAAFLLLALLASTAFAFQSVEDYTDASISSVLEESLEVPTIVDCDASAGDWLCTIYPTTNNCSSELVSRSGNSNLLWQPQPARIVAAQIVGQGRAELPAQSLSDACQLESPTTAQVVDSGEGTLVVNGELPGVSEQDARVAMELAGPSKNRFWKWWAGTD